jgi:hypothetical protein
MPGKKTTYAGFCNKMQWLRREKKRGVLPSPPLVFQE